MPKTLISYCTSFFHKGKNYSCLKQTPSELEKCGTQAEAFAWGCIRTTLTENGLPLEGVATNVVVVEDTTGTVVFSMDIIDIPSCLETFAKHE